MRIKLDLYDGLKLTYCKSYHILVEEPEVTGEAEE